MFSKNQQKLIRQLGQKKYRKQLGLFLVQGEKNVLELLHSAHPVEQLFATEHFIDQHANALKNIDVVCAPAEQLSKVSTLVSNNQAIAITPTFSATTPTDAPWQLALDGVSDPGNLGTIIRLADWYGFSEVLLGENCTDPYNPKTISATMGSFTRVTPIQLDLPAYLAAQNKPVYGAFLQGENIHHCEFSAQGVLVMGSESHGISQAVAAHISQPITITGLGQAESLNVAIASGIILDNIKRCNQL